MVGCIITGHGTFAEGMLGAFEMIAGQQDALVAVPFHEDEAGEFPDKLAAAIDGLLAKGEVVVFTDLMGGTPFNQSMMQAAQKDGIQVVSGTNLPMLLEAVMSREESTTAQDLCKVAVEAGQTGVAHAELPSDEPDADVEEEDGI